jgi:hypothetical protein
MLQVGVCDAQRLVDLVKWVVRKRKNKINIMDAKLKKVVSQLKAASKMHLAQSKIIEKHIKDMQKMSKKKK